MEKEVKFQQKRRYLSVSEHCLDIHYYNKPTKIGVLFSCDVITSLNEISLEMIKKAMRILSLHHQLLKSVIEADENGDLYFKVLSPEKSINTDDWLSIRSEKIRNIRSWVSFIDPMTEMGFVKGNPLWEIVWCDVDESQDRFTYVLILKAHHAIMDGKSNFDFICNQFLPLLREIVQEVDIFSVKLPVERFPKSFEDIFINLEKNLPFSKVPESRIHKWLFTFLFWKHRRFDVTIKDKTIRLAPYSKFHENVRDHIYPLILTKELTSSLLRFCKSAGITVNNIVTALIMKVLKKEEFKNGNSKFNKYKIFVTGDSRKFNKSLNTSPMPLGNYLSHPAVFQLSSPKDDAKDSLLECAKIVEKNVAPMFSLENFDKDTVIALIKALSLNQAMNLEEIYSGINMDDMLLISNIGLCKDQYQQEDESDEVLKLKEHYVLGNHTHVTLYVSCATFDGKMSFVLNGNYHRISLEYLTCIGQALINEIQELK